jgi:VanZ family protein
MTAFSFAASVLLEFSQEWFPNRVPSVNDVCAQSIGAFWGGIGWMFAGQPVVDWTRRWSATIDTHDRLNKVLSLAVAAHVLSLVLPLDLTIRPSDLWHKYKGGGIRLVPFQDLVPKAPEAWFELVFLISGSAVAGWLMSRLLSSRECRLRRSFRLLLGGLAFCVFLEFIQLLVYSRMSKVDDVILGTMSFVMGGLLLPSNADTRTPVHERFRFGKALMVTICLAWLLLFYWWPLDFTLNPEILAERGKHFFKVPFVVLYAGSYVNALADILRKGCLFALLAMLFAAALDEHRLFSLSRRSLLLASWGGCLLVAILIEVGQVALPSRTADLTDVIVYGTGSAFGMLLASYLKGPNATEREIQFAKCHRQEGRVA